MYHIGSREAWQVMPGATPSQPKVSMSTKRKTDASFLMTTYSKESRILRSRSFWNLQRKNLRGKNCDWSNYGAKCSAGDIANTSRRGFVFFALWFSMSNKYNLQIDIFRFSCAPVLSLWLGTIYRVIYVTKSSF